MVPRAYPVSPGRDTSLNRRLRCRSGTCAYEARRRDEGGGRASRACLGDAIAEVRRRIVGPHDAADEDLRRLVRASHERPAGDVLEAELPRLFGVAIEGGGLDVAIHGG